MRIYSIVALALTIALPTIAADIYVPYIAPTIQDAMNVANPGDRILIEDGAYYESYIVVADGVTVAPMRGDATTVFVDAQGNGRVFLLQERSCDHLMKGRWIIALPLPRFLRRCNP